MQLEDFFNAVESHEELQGVAIDKNSEGGQFIIEHITSKMATILPAAAVEKADWDVLQDILVGRREPEVLYHMTRVVGYYSRVENWNQSKIGELTDRHAGDYAVASAF
ncbi:MAG: hypothetical protein ACOCX4_08210 [Planctomycetota bacterium]